MKKDINARISDMIRYRDAHPDEVLSRISERFDLNYYTVVCRIRQHEQERKQQLAAHFAGKTYSDACRRSVLSYYCAHPGVLLTELSERFDVAYNVLVQWLQAYMQSCGKRFGHCCCASDTDS